MEKILLVADNPDLLATRAAVLATKKIEVVSSTAREFIAQTKREEFDLVVLCHSLNETAQYAVMKNVRQRWPDVRVLRIFKHFAEMSPSECGTDDVTTPEPTVLIGGFAAAGGLLIS